MFVLLKYIIEVNSEDDDKIPKTMIQKLLFTLKIFIDDGGNGVF